MNGSRKLLRGIFLFLLVLIIAQIVYYLFVSAPQKTQNYQRNQNTEQTQEIKEATTTLIHDPKQAISEYNLTGLRAYKIGLLTSSLLENKIEGIITEIDDIPQTNTFIGTLGQSLYEYKLKLVVQGKNNNDVTTFFFRDVDLESLTFFENKLETEVPIEKEQLRIGDIITVIEKIDLLKEWQQSYLSYKIIKQ